VLPVDILKIDVEFVRDLPASRASRYVVEAVVSLARAFGQRTIAEGVENHETLVMLAGMGVDFAQGHFVGRPRPLHDALGVARA
jgi:EAL domain-containing protein (putative c-di-GMP-specific phosphodiesterase class I)